jgi:hypothetical protein
MLRISSCAALQIVDASRAQALYLMPTHLTLAYVVDEQANPARIRAEAHVEVPLLTWPNPAAEDEGILRVMMQNSAEFTLLASGLSMLDRGFWTKVQRNTRALIIHPSLEGRFFVPEHSLVFLSALVDRDRIVCVGPPARAGTVVAQGERRGYILPVQDGVMSIRIGTADAALKYQ